MSIRVNSWDSGPVWNRGNTCTSNLVLKHIMTSLSDPPCLIEHELYVENAVLDSSYVVHTGVLMSVSVPGERGGGGVL